VQVFQRRSPGQPKAAAAEDLAISGPLRSVGCGAVNGGRAAGSRVTWASWVVVHWQVVRWVPVVLLLAGCASGPPANVRIDPGPTPETARLHARPAPEFRPGQPGLWPIGAGTTRDGLLYVPEAARSRPVPLLVMLHGAGGSPEHLWDAIRRDAEERSVAVLMPASRQWTWDFRRPGNFGFDRAFIDAALASTFGRVPVDPTHVALGGFSAGATFALSLGPSNGDLFHWIFGFSPTGLEVWGPVGHPEFLIAHGTADSVVPIAPASRQIVPALRNAGYRVVYREFPGGDHEIFPEAVHEAFSLLVSD